MDTVTFQITSKEELKDLLRDIVGEVFEEKLDKRFGQSTERLMTRREAAECLRFSLPTLDNLTKQGIIPSVRINGNIRYSSEDITLNEAKYKKLKHQRSLNTTTL